MNIFKRFINRYFHKKLNYATEEVLGFLYVPRYANYKGIVYCHGGFSKIDKGDYDSWVDVKNYITHGYSVLAIKFPDEYVVGKTWDLLSDVNECFDAGTTLLKTNPYNELYLAGLSRGGFTALSTFFRDTTHVFKKCVTFSAPTRVETWKELGFFKNGLPKEAQDYFLKEPDPYTLSKNVMFNPNSLLLIHGFDDEIVPFAQAIDLSLRADCYIKLYSNCGHDVYKNPEAATFANEFFAGGTI